MSKKKNIGIYPILRKSKGGQESKNQKLEGGRNAERKNRKLKSRKTEIENAVLWVEKKNILIQIESNRYIE